MAFSQSRGGAGIEDFFKTVPGTFHSPPGRESLYKALSAEGNPEFATVQKVVKSLGLKLCTAAV